MRLINYLIENEKQKSLSVAKMLSARPNLIRAVKDRDGPAVKRIIVEAQRDAGLDFITVSDKNGIVIARSHSEQAGDSSASQINVRQALSGASAVGLEPGNVVKFSLRAGHPVRTATRSSAWSRRA